MITTIDGKKERSMDSNSKDNMLGDSMHRRRKLRADSLSIRKQNTKMKKIRLIPGTKEIYGYSQVPKTKSEAKS